MAHQKALDIRTKLAHDHRDVSKYQDDLATSHINLGRWFKRKGPPEKAEAAYRKALEIRDNLVRKHPTVSEYQDKLATSHVNLGTLYDDLGKPEQAEAPFRKALDISTEVVRRNPGVPEYQSTLALSYQNLGTIYSKTNRPEQAETAYQEAVRIQEKLAHNHTGVFQYQVSLANSYSKLYDLYTDTARQGQAQAFLDKALDIREKLFSEKLLSAYPARAEVAVGLGGSYCNKANRLLTVDGKPEEALKWYDRAIRTLTTVLKQNMQHARAREYLRNTYGGQSEALLRLSRYTQALESLDRAIDLDNGQKRDDYRWGRTNVLARMGKHTKATEELEEWAGKSKLTARDFYDAACVYSLSVLAVRKDAGLAQTDRDQLSEGYATRAVGLLEKAQKDGYFNRAGRVERLKKDPDLDPLRSREDFRKLLNELEKPLQTGGK